MKLNLVKLFLLICLIAPVLGRPHIGYLYPAGGQSGTSFYVLIGGQGLQRVGDIYCTAPSITGAEIINVPPPQAWPPIQRKWIDQSLRALKAGESITKPPVDDPDWKKNRLFENLDKLPPHELNVATRDFFTKRNSLQMSPSLNHRCFVKVTIPEDVVPGKYEFRVETKEGMSNALPFFVGKNEEYCEPDFPFPREDKKKLTVKIPSVMNGQIFPEEGQDSYLFSAKKGEKITFVCRGRELFPFQGDCVPGYFQPVLEVTDSDDKSLAYVDDYYFQADPVLVFEAPEEGTYQLHIKDALYRGRADFVYRIEAMHEPYAYPLFPFSDSGLLGKLIQCDAHEYTVKSKRPLMIQGTLNEVDKAKVFPISLKKGEEIVAEVYARRLNSPLDSTLTIKNAQGKILAFNDDYKRFPISVLAQDADSYLKFKAPKDGVYSLILADRTSLGGDDYAYHLRISAPIPQARLFQTPTSTTLKSLHHEPVSFILEGHEGFDESISLSIEGDSDFSISGPQEFPAGTTQILTTMSTKGKPRVGKLQIVATTPSGMRILAQPCESVIQAFASMHYLPSKDWMVKVMPAYSQRVPFEWEGILQKKVEVKSGESVKLTIKMLPWLKKTWMNSQLRLRHPQEGIGLEYALEKESISITLKAPEGKKVSESLSVVVEIFAESENKEKKKVPLSFTLPAFLLQINP